MTSTARRDAGRAALVSLSLLALAVSLSSQDRDYIRTHYTKAEHRIDVDGVVFTAVYVPNDAVLSHSSLTGTRWAVGPVRARGLHLHLSDVRGA
jgi:hypothetical protein